MKKFLFLLLSVAVASGMFSSCELETSGAGAFDGMWHLVMVDTVSTGGKLDMSKKRIYWCFQYKLMQTDDKDGYYKPILMRFSHEHNALFLTEPYIYDRENGDKPITDESESFLLTPYGINKINEEFKVISISSNRMQLQSQMLKLTFKKF